MVRSHHVLMVSRVGRRVLSRRSNRHQSHRLPLMVEDHRPHRWIHHLLITVQDRRLHYRSRRLLVSLLFSTAGLGALECRYGLFFSRSSIADSTCPHPSPIV